MYPPPGPELSDATVAELDDQFFTSDPFAYIRSRILRLLSEDPPSFEGPAADEFTRLLGPSAAAYRSSEGRTSTLQVAVDAFALRHQVAETLLRFLHVVLHHEPGRSHWVELVDTPMKMLDVLRQNRVVFDAQEDNGAQMMRDALVAPITAGTVSSAAPPLAAHADNETIASAPVRSDEVDRALDVFIQWINYAIVLITQQSPDLNAAHNKFKHGMGIRPQDDVLSVILASPPNPDGTDPLSALQGDRAIPLFNGVTMEYLSRASPRHGLEATQLVMNPVPTLVEAGAMAHTLALLFHSAGVKHFHDHAPQRGRIVPGHPGLLVDGPIPSKLRPDRPFALRFPLTTPLRAGVGPEAWMFWTSGKTVTLHFGERLTSVVVDDTSPRD